MPQSGQKKFAVGLHGVKLVGRRALLLKRREGRKSGKAGGSLSPGAVGVEPIGLKQKFQRVRDQTEQLWRLDVAALMSQEKQPR